ncbi:g9318 [Coccomyxa viridis]|uniref:G9318 protein n=1 Tax=Coccomyxa viridis TaxID=1274662 RepID=A0ABP1G2P3_9CHLO
MGKTCTRCAVDKPLDDFPLKNSKAPNGPRIAMCKPCRNAYSLEKKKAKNPDMKTRNLRTNLVTEETQKCDACELVKNGMAYHHPIVDGKKQCRDCEEWKVLETEFPTRKDSIDGYFHECKDCRRDNARDYGHVKWNAILSDRRENDEQYRRRVKHREGLRDTAIYKQSLDRYITETACTGHEIREWFEHRFEGDITWGTYGKGKVWTIDHVIPLVWFDLTKADERALAFNWINIQPHRENFRKHVEIRVDEIQAAFVAAHAFLQRTGEMELFSIVPKMLAWLQDKADVTEVSGGSSGTVTVSGGSLGYASLWVDYVYLDTDERRRFAQVSHEYLIEQLQFTGGESVSQNANKIRLNFNHPVKELIWAVVSDVNTAANDNFNYTAMDNHGNIINPMVSGKLQLNGHDRFDERLGSYFNLVQPYQHHTNIPRSKGINVYSFGLKPEEHQPSGTCNFSRIDNATLNLTLQPGFGGGVLNVYAPNYNVLNDMNVGNEQQSAQSLETDLRQTVEALPLVACCC